MILANGMICARTSSSYGEPAGVTCRLNYYFFFFYLARVLTYRFGRVAQISQRKDTRAKKSQVFFRVPSSVHVLKRTAKTVNL